MDHAPLEHFRIDADHWPSLLVRVNADTGGDYGRFRASLDARYGLVWRDIAIGYGALAVILGLVATAPGLAASLAAAMCGAVAVGFVIAYLQLFIHEAAHWNLASDRQTSDRLANLLIAWQVGTSVAAYRKVHFDHHRHLGQTDDGERSYVHRLSLRLLIELLTGAHALRIFLARSRARPSATRPSSRLPLLRGVVVHALLLAVLVTVGAWSAALAWLGGMTIFFPFFATLRPLLEHRPAACDSAVLSVGKREAVTRLFADGPLARTFGGAGFSRHLLHHWEPQVSYTRLNDLEHYLLATSIGAIIEARRTTYFQAFRAILASDHGR